MVLALDDHLIEHRAAILDDDVAQNAHRAGSWVELDFTEMRRIGECNRRRVAYPQ